MRAGGCPSVSIAVARKDEALLDGGRGRADAPNLDPRVRRAQVRLRHVADVSRTSRGRVAASCRKRAPPPRAASAPRKWRRRAASPAAPLAEARSARRGACHRKAAPQRRRVGGPLGGQRRICGSKPMSSIRSASSQRSAVKGRCARLQPRLQSRLQSRLRSCGKGHRSTLRSTRPRESASSASTRQDGRLLPKLLSPHRGPKTGPPPATRVRGPQSRRAACGKLPGKVQEGSGKSGPQRSASRPGVATRISARARRRRGVLWHGLTLCNTASAPLSSLTRVVQAGVRSSSTS